ncbi:hypothetical protein BaRGS_00009365 [Batillaria attramentaria]|uniref:Uncharacterized protein n=1 Tax=Batillaria attramentaria TaxID=370345 RepID=A0ABD0LIW8_9CAEN
MSEVVRYCSSWGGALFHLQSTGIKKVRWRQTAMTRRDLRGTDKQGHGVMGNRLGNSLRDKTEHTNGLSRVLCNKHREFN